MQTTPRVLFLSRGNSTRSHMAEGFLRTRAADLFIPASAGIEPSRPDPLATEVMKEIGIDIRGQESKDVAQALREHFSYVITFYDAAKERSPIFPFTFNLLRWSTPDPAAVTGSHKERKEAFRRVRDEIDAKIQRFLDEIGQKEQHNGHPETCLTQDLVGVLRNGSKRTKAA